MTQQGHQHHYQKYDLRLLYGGMYVKVFVLTLTLPSTIISIESEDLKMELCVIHLSELDVNNIACSAVCVCVHLSVCVCLCMFHYSTSILPTKPGSSLGKYQTGKQYMFKENLKTQDALLFSPL